MSAKVRCAETTVCGQIIYGRDPCGWIKDQACHSARAIESGVGHPFKPCGWRGLRVAHLIPGRKGSWGDPTAKPCPRCGGRVALIPPDPDLDGAQ